MTQRALDPAFIDQQKHRLLTLRSQLLAVRQGERNEERDLNTELTAQPHEYEDEAQRLAAIDIQEDLLDRNDARLTRIERALQKIDEGTYGLSDASGKPLSLERLRAVPEALYTEEEQRQREQRGR